MFEVRKSQERGYHELSWLKAKYTFSFAGYYDENFTGLGPLIVINEDRIAPGKGFAPHPHKDMEIISYIISGAIEHKDSMGNEGVVRPGGIQYMSAGTGVVHSEYNPLQDQETHMLQVWIRPDKDNYPPNYGQDDYSTRLLPNELCLLASRDGAESSIQINQDVLVYTARLETGKNIVYENSQISRAWLQLVRGVLDVNGHILNEGDGLSISDEGKLIFKGMEDSEFLFFDLG